MSLSSLVLSVPLDRSAEADLRHPIGWCDRTENPGVYGCEHASKGCLNCYAEVVAAKLVHMAAVQGKTSPYAPVVTDGRWNREVAVDLDRAAKAFDLPKRIRPGGRPLRTFVFSMGDLFHEAVPFEFLDVVFARMEAGGPHVFQALTKRHLRMLAYAEDRRRRGLAWPANVWAGVTVDEQRQVERAEALLEVCAAVRFVSVEPMLSRIRFEDGAGRSILTRWRDLAPGEVGTVYPNGKARGWHGIDQVIIGCESDGPKPGARDTEHAWIFDLVEQVDDRGAALFLKQAVIDGRLIERPAIGGRQRLEFPIPIPFDAYPSVA